MCFWWVAPKYKLPKYKLLGALSKQITKGRSSELCSAMFLKFRSERTILAWLFDEWPSTPKKRRRDQPKDGGQGEQEARRWSRASVLVYEEGRSQRRALGIYQALCWGMQWANWVFMWKMASYLDIFLLSDLLSSLLNLFPRPRRIHFSMSYLRGFISRLRRRWRLTKKSRKKMVPGLTFYTWKAKSRPRVIIPGGTSGSFDWFAAD